MSGRHDRRGFVLIAALGLLVAFSAVGLAVGMELWVTRLGAANAAEHAAALEAAHAGVAEIQSRLAHARDAPEAWAELDSLADTVEVDDARAVVRVADLGTRLNLNVADEDELRRLFTALRIDVGEADRLAQRISDWRDGDDLRRGRGAEAAEYAGAGLPPPRNASFERLIDLEAVFGMTAERYRRIRPYVTVHGTGRVNLNAAEPEVLRSLRGMSEGAIRVLRSRRAAGRPVASMSELLQLLPGDAREALLPEAPRLEGRVVFETREVEVVSEARLPASPMGARVRAVLARAGSQALVVWRAAE